MNDIITLEMLCGEHIFSGCELTTDGDCNVCLFTLDGITYEAYEDPDDGYRSYCRSISASEIKPQYSFEGIRVVCHMMESNEYRTDNVLVIRDVMNGKIVLEVGTVNTDDYYPHCHFEYTPENMACNCGNG